MKIIVKDAIKLELALKSPGKMSKTDLEDALTDNPEYEQDISSIGKRISELVKENKKNPTKGIVRLLDLWTYGPNGKLLKVYLLPDVGWEKNRYRQIWLLVDDDELPRDTTLFGD